MSCIWVKEALAVKGNKFKLEDISFDASVSELKAKLSESSGIDEKLHGIKMIKINHNCRYCTIYSINFQMYEEKRYCYCNIPTGQSRLLPNKGYQN